MVIVDGPDQRKAIYKLAFVVLLFLIGAAWAFLGMDMGFWDSMGMPRNRDFRGALWVLSESLPPALIALVVAAIRARRDRLSSWQIVYAISVALSLAGSAWAFLFLLLASQRPEKVEAAIFFSRRALPPILLAAISWAVALAMRKSATKSAN